MQSELAPVLAHPAAREIIDFRAVMRNRKSRAIGQGPQGLRAERKALAVRYTLDADEALRREQLAAEVVAHQFEEDGAVCPSGEEQSVSRPPPPPGPTEYVIQLQGVGCLWRWAVFGGSGVGGRSALPGISTGSPHAVAAGVLPRLSERSALRAAKRAARGAYHHRIASASG
jgi:hypothetical protein